MGDNDSTFSRATRNIALYEDQHYEGDETKVYLYESINGKSLSIIGEQHVRHSNDMDDEVGEALNELDLTLLEFNPVNELNPFRGIGAEKPYMQIALEQAFTKGKPYVFLDEQLIKILEGNILTGTLEMAGFSKSDAIKLMYMQQVCIDLMHLSSPDYNQIFNNLLDQGIERAEAMDFTRKAYDFGRKILSNPNIASEFVISMQDVDVQARDKFYYAFLRELLKDDRLDKIGMVLGSRHAERIAKKIESGDTETNLEIDEDVINKLVEYKEQILG